jgi:hypothetical protein
MTDDLVRRLRDWDGKWREDAKAEAMEAADRIEELEIKLAAKVCPLGGECDLTVAYMLGVKKAKDTLRAQAAEDTKE